MGADPETLSRLAQKLRRHAVLMTSEAGSGHPTSCMSAAEIFSTLFFHTMDVSRDAFVLSKGHAAPILYAALKELGLIKEDLLSLRRFDSILEGHPTPRIPGVAVATGSLGQGLAAACGMALARRLDGRPGRVYCLMGDGETAEGSVWESAQFASHARLDNLLAVVDVNALGQSGPTIHGHDTGAFVEKFRAFGWRAVAVDGHSIPELIAALSDGGGTPTAVIARTIKGKGVAAIEGKEGWHGKPVADLEAALAEIGNPTDTVPAVTVTPRAFEALTVPALTPAYKKGDQAATRNAYGVALAALGAGLPELVVLDGDTKNSTFSETFKHAFPDRYIECYIAEQNMVGMALGLSAEGKIPCVSTFAAFMTRAYDFIRMGVYSRPRHLVLCGSHAGVSIGEDGPSQMGLEDLAMMRALLDSTVLYPGDAVAAENLTAEAIARGGIVYLRTSRPKVPVIYDNTERFPVGGSKVFAGTDATVVAAGVTLHEALAARDALAREKISLRVIDAYSVKPIDEKALRNATRETGIILTVEDHAAWGGLGEAVAAVVPVRAILAVREVPRSGKSEELLDAYGISRRKIAAAVRAAVKG
ncbi:MAG: transketolase [Candidatus Handelsmanbacteria bacterium RIFCSPLOWO2_12_FULL_64_10]|uniref:Transketolase n=1 Tax=Handelsmanbacteria sp. (strain RIFCSPLOWO2_12_FULL_64_10) TaxID=1817868 RepID=A0A1F6CAM4_HANXR|nr:MAG: transketolase [Candidatus Handelsmanbacteria bacterium RIFCSPLOWO2_12_FULL_64_10]